MKYKRRISDGTQRNVEDICVDKSISNDIEIDTDEILKQIINKINSEKDE